MVDKEKIKLLRFMILSTTQGLSEKYGKELFGVEIKDGCFTKEYKKHELKAFCKWPNSQKGLFELPTVDVMIIRIENEKDWMDLLEYVNERSLIQFKIVVWNIELPNLLELCKPTIVCKPDGKTPSELFDEIIKSENEIELLLSNVFKNFDKSNDGFIDMSEIETICRELGVDTTKADFQETLRALDVNNDKKISFEEFSDWWKQGRQNSKLMETLITMKLATSTFLNSLSDTTYMNSIKEKIELVTLEKKELVNSFLCLNIEKVTMHPEAVISLDGYFGGEKKETISKSYCQNYGEGLKSSHYFLIIEFELKDPSQIESMIKMLNVLINTLRDSLKYVSRQYSDFINNEISIMALKKDETTICLSFKLRRQIKEQLSHFEMTLKGFVDEVISQNISLSFTLSGDINKVKEKPTSSFIETFNPAASLELKTEILKKNVKFLVKLAEQVPRQLKLWLHSYNGSRVELNFTLDYIKTLNNSFLNSSCKDIVEFLHVTLMNIIKEILSKFGGFHNFKKFYDVIKQNITLVMNSPQLYIVTKVAFNDITSLFE